MVFSSIIFIFAFLPVFLAGYYASGWRTGMLVLGSALFYTWGEGGYVLLLGALIALNWAGARAMGRAEGRARGLILAAMICGDLAVLGWFKYAGFLADNLNAVLPGEPITGVDPRLPLGISFFTFQLVSYAADVYLRRVEVERDPLKFAAYILMFPHLIAGPIVRYADIRDEMHADRRGTNTRGLGLQYFIVGLCQKVLIANVVAPVADHAFATPAAGLDAATAWSGVLAYALQIYFDFCGYSNMAIGLAFMLGFTFPRNFDFPYSARSVTEFWRRWHISLSSWFRDYVYIPLGGNRAGRARTVRNLLVVFLLTGLWHGAAWTFVVWGLWHGAFLLIERFGIGGLLERAPDLVRRGYLLLAVGLGWVFFRAESLPQAGAYLTRLFDPAAYTAPPLALQAMLDAEVLLAAIAGCILAFPLGPKAMRLLGARQAQSEPLPGRPLDTRHVHLLPVGLLLTGFALSLAMLAGDSLNPFLYFRF